MSLHVDIFPYGSRTPDIKDISMTSLLQRVPAHLWSSYTKEHDKSPQYKYIYLEADGIFGSQRDSE